LPCGQGKQNPADQVVDIYSIAMTPASATLCIISILQISAEHLSMTRASEYNTLQQRCTELYPRVLEKGADRMHWMLTVGGM
jgi:hypothetical protein